MSGCTVKAWAIEYTGSPLSGGRKHLRGTDRHLCRTLLFETRAEARRWLSARKKAQALAVYGPWAADGGGRIYHSVRVVPVTLTIEVVQ